MAEGYSLSYSGFQELWACLRSPYQALSILGCSGGFSQLNMTLGVILHDSYSEKFPYECCFMEQDVRFAGSRFRGSDNKSVGSVP